MAHDYRKDPSDEHGRVTADEVRYWMDNPPELIEYPISVVDAQKIVNALLLAKEVLDAHNVPDEGRWTQCPLCGSLMEAGHAVEHFKGRTSECQKIRAQHGLR